jgi:hypothetical protein
VALVARQGAVERRISKVKKLKFTLPLGVSSWSARHFLSDAWADKSARYRIAARGVCVERRIYKCVCAITPGALTFFEFPARASRQITAHGFGAAAGARAREREMK